MIICTFYFYAVYPPVLYTLWRILPSGPCPNRTVCLIVTWDSLLPAVYQLVIWLYIYFYLWACIRQIPKTYSLPSGFLHYCSHVRIRCLPKLHTVPVVTTQYFPISLENTWTNILSFSLFYLFIYVLILLFNEKSIFKARIEKMNLSETMKHFLLLPFVKICWLLWKTFVSLISGLYIFLVSKIRGQKTAERPSPQILFYP